MLARGLCASFVCLLIVAAAGAPARATIFLQRSIAGVRIGMTKSQVRTVLGKPGYVKRGRTPAVKIRDRNGRLALGYYTEYRWPGLRVVFTGDRTVTSISTTRRSQRTPRGLGVGTTKQELKARVAGLHCRVVLGSNYCYLGTLKYHTRTTVFYIESGRVSRIEVGLSYVRSQ